MKKKNIVKMILVFHGYSVESIKTYKQGGTQGTVVSVWEVDAYNKELDNHISLMESSFQELMHELFRTIKTNSLIEVRWVDDEEFSLFT